MIASRNELSSGGRERLDAGGQAREFPRDGVLVHDALAGGALHFRLRRLQRHNRVLPVAAGNRRLHPLDEGPHARFARMIEFGALAGLPDALAR